MVDRRHLMAKASLLVTLTAAALATSSAAYGAPPTEGGGFIPPSETEPNNTFSTRSVVTGPSSCHSRTFYTAKLGGTDARVPDTMACFTGFAQEFCTAQNDDGGPYASYGGSAMFFLQSAGPFQLRVTGSGNPGFGNGVQHGELGEFEVYIRFYDVSGTFISETVLNGELVTGDETILFDNIPLAPSTFDFDIIINPLAAEQGDVDFYEFDGLRPGGAYEVRIVAGADDRILPPRALDTVMAEFTSTGVQTGNFNDDIGLVPNPSPPPAQYFDPRSVVTITADASGRLFFAISGYNDTDFDGADNNSFFPLEPHSNTGQYTFRLAHVCATGCADLDGDCDVDGADLAELLTRWGTTCP